MADRTSAGDVAAFAVLLSRYWQPLVSYAAPKLRDLDAAEDVVQEAFVRLWENRTALRTATSPCGYLYRLVHNLTIDELRKQQVRRTHSQQMQASSGPPPTPAQLIEADELAEAAAEALRGMPVRRHDVFVLGNSHNLSYRQIAETLGITPRTVANHMSLALHDLREALGPFLDRRLGPP